MKRGFRAGNQFLDAEGCVLWKGLCDIRVGWSNSALKRRSYSNLMNLFWIPRLLNGKAFHRLEIERRTNSGSDARYSVLYLAFPALTCWTNHTPSSPLKPPQLWALDRRPGMFLGVRKPFIWSSGFLLEHSGKTLLSKLRSRAGRLRIWSVTRCTRVSSDFREEAEISWDFV